MTQNSITDFLDQVMRTEQNSMQVLSALNSIATSSSDTVTFNIEDSNGTVNTYTVETLAFTNKEIKRIDDNFNSLTGMNGAPVNVRMSDGSYKRIYQRNLYKAPNKLGSLNIPTSFYQKNNYFFDNLIDPTLYVPFDISSFIGNNIRKVQTLRIIFDSSSSINNSYFDSNFKGRNDLDYSDVIKQIIDNGLTYFADDTVIDLPVSISRYSGTFDIISYEDSPTTLISTSGVSYTSTVRKWTLNTLNYTDNLSNSSNSLSLKVGDIMEVGEASTYTVKLVDKSTSSVVLELTTGTEPLKIGSGVLSIGTTSYSSKEVQVSISVDERQIVFIKPIDNDYNLASTDYSPGVAFYSNELVTTFGTGTLDLNNFYKNQVVDLSKTLLSQAKENIIPSILGIKPDAPKLVSSDFKVDVVNSHKLGTKAVKDIQGKIGQKNQLSTEIAQLDSSINTKRVLLNTTNFTTDADKSAVQADLDKLIKQRDSANTQYISIVNDLSTTASNLPSELTNPKYAIRGFFDIPSPKVSVSGPTQNVIQFIYSYRYLSVDNSSDSSTQYDYTGKDGTLLRGYFSPWIEYKSDIRTKTYNTSTGTYEWDDLNTENPDFNSINQINVPITAGEKVELRVKAVSEAGWPLNPLVSDWSSSVIIAFPEDLSTQQSVVDSLISSTNEAVKVSIDSELNSKGLDQHLSTSFVIKDKYFAHDANSISSGFFNVDGSIISLRDKLIELDNKFNNLNNTITQGVGKLQVYIKDESGNTISASNNSLVSLFAGFYNDKKTTKCEVLSNTYYLVLENIGSTSLQLASRYPGGISSAINPSTDNSFDFDLGLRNYQYAPVVYSKQDSDSQIQTELAPQGTRQVRSQFIYVRGVDIGLMNSLYTANGVKDAATLGVTGYTGLVDKNWKSSGFQSQITQYNYGEASPVENLVGFNKDIKDAIGSNSCGASLYLSPYNIYGILVDGRDYLANKEIESGASKSISIPIVFDYRLEDSVGSIMGDNTNSLTNFSISKKIGIDILVRNSSLFSFDIEITSKYKNDSQSQISSNITKNSSITTTSSNF